MYIRDAWVEVDRKKLTHNYMEVRRAVGDQVKICAVLKAQCYGLGGALVGHVLEELGEKGPDAYAVAVVSEALELREFIPPEKEILVLGYVSEDGYDTVIEHDITLAMYREEALATLDRHAEAMGKKARVHIKVNSGMNRLGFLPTEESADAVARCMQLKNLDVTGIFTHLATADETDKSGARMQMRRFDAFLAMLKARGIWLYGADAEGENYRRVNFSGPCALVIGSEGDGISRLVREQCDHIVSIPMRNPAMESLNASVAAGILMYAAAAGREE